jgi:predicted outer membrane protein
MLNLIKKYWVWIAVILLAFVLYYAGSRGYAAAQVWKEKIKMAEQLKKANAELTDQMTKNQEAYDKRYIQQDISYQRQLDQITAAKAASDRKIADLQIKIKTVEAERDEILKKIYSKNELDARFHFILVGKPKPAS